MGGVGTFSALALACKEAERQHELGRAPSFTVGAGGRAGRDALGTTTSLPGLFGGGARKMDEDGFLVPGTPTRVGKKGRTGVGAGAVGVVLESGSKPKSVLGRERDKGKASGALAKIEREETKAEENEVEASNKTVGLQDLARSESLIKSCCRLLRNVPSTR